MFDPSPGVCKPRAGCHFIGFPGMITCGPVGQHPWPRMCGTDGALAYISVCGGGGSGVGS